MSFDQSERDIDVPTDRCVLQCGTAGSQLACLIDKLINVHNQILAQCSINDILYLPGGGALLEETLFQSVSLPRPLPTAR